MKAIVESLDDVPEALHGEYEERDGKYVLKLEDTPPGYIAARDHNELKRKLDSFRDNNRGLLKRAAELAGVDEIDEDLSPLRDAIGSLKDELEKAKRSQPGSEDIQAQIQKAVKPLQEKLDRAERERLEQQQRADRALLRETFSSSLSKAGARSSAMDFLLDQAEKSFEVNEDKVVARNGLLSEEDNPGEPMKPSEWVKGVVKKYDFAFEKSDGGDVPPSGPGGRTAPPPGVKVLKNPTSEQLGDPKIAQALREGKLRIANG